MTKINKLGKSTFVIAILSFILVAVLAFGGTYAYFSAQSTAVNGEVVTGHLRITNIGEWDAEGNKIGGATLASTTSIVKPGQTIYENTKVTTEVETNISYFTRVRFNINVTPKAGHTHFTDGWDHDGDGTDTEQGQTAGKLASDCGDYLANEEGNRHYAEILNIVIANGGVSGARNAEQGEKTILWESGAATVDYSTGEVVYYKLAETVVADNAGALADDYDITNHTANAPKTEDFTFTMSVKNWVGDNGQASPVDAEGCEFWMDATIEVRIIVEVIQSDFLTLVDDKGTAQDEEDDVTYALEGEAATGRSFKTGADAAAVWALSLGVQKA